jgi:hypothetical protein
MKEETAVVLFTLVCFAIGFLNGFVWGMDYDSDEQSFVCPKPAVEKVPLYYNIDDNSTIYIFENGIFKEVYLK